MKKNNMETKEQSKICYENMEGWVRDEVCKCVIGTLKKNQGQMKEAA